ncbi:hypothetical protein UP00_19685, partial [Enterobacter asburiae]
MDESADGNDTISSSNEDKNINDSYELDSDINFQNDTLVMANNMVISTGIEVGIDGESEDNKIGYHPVIVNYQNLIGFCEQFEENSKNVLLAIIFRNMGLIYSHLNMKLDEEAMYNKVLGLCNDSRNQMVSEEVNRACMHLDVPYNKESLLNSVIYDYKELIKTVKAFGNDLIVSMLYRCLALAYERLDDFGESIIANRLLTEQFDDTDNISMQIQLSMAYRHMGDMYRKIKNYHEALGSYKNVIEKFSNADCEALLVQVVIAYYKMGKLYGELGKIEDELECYRFITLK